MNDTIMPHTRQKVKKNQYGIIIPQILVIIFAQTNNQENLASRRSIAQKLKTTFVLSAQADKIFIK